MSMSPQELKKVMSSGLLSFPITDFDAEGNFNAKTYAERLDWLAPYGASALFAAGGTGEFFSLTAPEYSQVIKVAVESCRGKVPLLAGTGGPTRQAIALAQEAERLGADGLLLLPHYLTEQIETIANALRAELFEGVSEADLDVCMRVHAKILDNLERS